MKIAILGAGAWGTGIAVNLGQRHTIQLWAHHVDEAQAMQSAHLNARYLPDIALPASITISADLQVVLRDAEVVLVATPVSALRPTLQRLAESNLADEIPIVWLCKGFEESTGLLPHQIFAGVCGKTARPHGVLSGPSFAIEVARLQPAALTLAMNNLAACQLWASRLHHDTLRVYATDDVIGVETGGAVKNVMAIAVGICDGLGLGENARAAVITRGLAEITRLGIKLGGHPETFAGLTGLGDLVLTCAGNESRNRRVGLMLAQGKSLEAILQSLGHVAEGVLTTREVQRLAARLDVSMPITDAVTDVLYNGVPIQNAIRHLLARDPAVE